MNHRRMFFRSVVPSMLAFALSGVYAVVDGFFVGNSLGDLGLAAINLAYPIAALIQALGTGIGMAGAIRVTVLRAQGKERQAGECFGGAALLLLAAGGAVTGLTLVFGEAALRLLGARGEVLAVAGDYVRVIALGAVLQLLGTGLVPFIRNMGGAAFAMLAMIAGFAANIALDALFVWVCRWGMTGAAGATVIGQGVTMLAALLYLRRKRARFTLPRPGELPGAFRSLLMRALPPLGLTFSPNITLILMNRFLLRYGGEDAVAAYACIAYITSVVYLLLQGIGDGSQPLISRYYGENSAPDVRRIRSLTYRSGTAVALACMAGLFLARGRVGVLFGASAAVGGEVALLLPLFLSSLCVLSFVRITTAYLYATEQGRLSSVMVYAEPVLLLFLLALLAPLSRLGGVWAAVPLAQGLAGLAAVCVKRRADRRLGTA